MSEASRSILITGANGFVGARLCRKFIDEGLRVIAGVRKSADLSRLEGINVVFRYGDVTRPESLPAMVSEVDFIIHNAGVVKARSNRQFFEVNHGGTAALFGAIAEHNPSVKKVIYISSLAAAGRSPNGKPLSENDKPHPLTTYGRSKLAGEQVAVSYKDRFPVVSLRPPGIYGPGDTEIFTFFDAVNKRIKPYIGDTNRKLQLIHVDDLCNGIYLAVTKQTDSGAIFFISENRGYSMKELIGLLEKGCGHKAYPLFVPAPLFKLIAFFSEFSFRLVGATPMLTREKAVELLESWEMNTDRARQVLGFVSQVSFEHGARETFEWYRQHGWLK